MVSDAPHKPAEICLAARQDCSQHLGLGMGPRLDKRDFDVVFGVLRSPRFTPKLKILALSRRL